MERHWAVVVYTFNPGTWKAERQVDLCEPEFSLVYRVPGLEKPVLKNKEKKKEKEEKEGRKEERKK